MSIISQFLFSAMCHSIIEERLLRIEIFGMLESNNKLD